MFKKKNNEIINMIFAFLKRIIDSKLVQQKLKMTIVKPLFI